MVVVGGMGTSGSVVGRSAEDCNGLDGLYRAVVAGIAVPIYEYQCQSCEKVFEYMQRMSEDAKTECEECKGRLERLISNTSFSLKGGGWYKDLYSSTKKETKGSSDSASPSSSGESSSSTPSSDAGASKSSGDSASSAAPSSSSGTTSPSAPSSSSTPASTGPKTSSGSK